VRITKTFCNILKLQKQYVVCNLSSQCNIMSFATYLMDLASIKILTAAAIVMILKCISMILKFQI
jgi:hypothetical protein